MTPVLEEVVGVTDPFGPKTPLEVIDYWLGLARFRSTFDSADVVDMLLDIRGALGAAT